MNTQQDFELTAKEIDELKLLMASSLGQRGTQGNADFFKLTDTKKIKQYLLKIKEFIFAPRNILTALPESICYLSNLEKLEINYGFITDRNSELHHSNISSSLTVLLEHIGQLKQLRTLIINSDYVTTLPENIGALQGLQELILHCNNLLMLPESIGQLKQLKSLCLNYCYNLSALPESIGQLKQLKSLCLNYCHNLSALPESIGQLHNLQKLELSICFNLTIPETFCQLNQLQELEIGSSYMTRLPENIGQFTGLKKLVLLEMVNITTLPESIGKLDNLQELHIASCQKLSFIPENLAHLKNLKRFYIADCENLKNIPQSIQALDCFTYFENSWTWRNLCYEEKEKQEAQQKEKIILTPEQKQAKKVVAQMKKDTATPFIKIKVKQAKKLPLTASKFGGVPYWLPEMPYPVDNNGDKLALLAQIDLAELPPLPDFPEKGLLQFFISNDDVAGLDFDNPLSQTGWRVVYHASVNPNISEKEVLNLAIPLENMPLGDTQYKLSFKLAQTSISPCDYRFEDLFKTTAQQLKITFDKNDEIFDLIDEDTHEKLYNSTAGHHIGGYPIFTQDDPRSEEQLAEHKILLLQIDTEGDIMWGDAGVGNFFITADDLKKRDFSRVLYNWDCA